MHQTWEKDIIFTPPNSTIQANCTAPSPELHFQLPGDPDAPRLRHFRAAEDVTFLNSVGFYQLPPVRSQPNTTLRVLINSTDSVINGTLIRCQAFQPFQLDINYRSTITVIGEHKNRYPNFDPYIKYKHMKNASMGSNT